MTTIQSIKNDAMTVGTAAVSAGAASAILNNQEGIKRAATKAADNIMKNAKAAVNKDTYTKMGEAVRNAGKKVNKENIKNIGETIKNTAKKPFNKKVYTDMADKFKNVKYTDIKDAVSGAAKNIKDGATKVASNVFNFVKTNWKFKGAMKMAGAAGAVALGLVVLKNVFSKNDAE